MIPTRPQHPNPSEELVQNMPHNPQEEHCHRNTKTPISSPVHNKPKDPKGQPGGKCLPSQYTKRQNSSLPTVEERKINKYITKIYINK